MIYHSAKCQLALSTDSPATEGSSGGTREFGSLTSLYASSRGEVKSKVRLYYSAL